MSKEEYVNLVVEKVFELRGNFRYLRLYGKFHGEEDITTSGNDFVYFGNDIGNMKKEDLKAYLLDLIKRNDYPIWMKSEEDDMEDWKFFIYDLEKLEII